MGEQIDRRSSASIASTNLPEARDDSQGKMKFKDYKDGDKHKDKTSACKFHSLKLALFTITCCTGLTLLYSPIEHNERLRPPESKSRFVDAGKVWQQVLLDPRYLSNIHVDWQLIGTIIRNINVGSQQDLKIGLLNFNSSEVKSWRATIPTAEFSLVRLSYANTSITWDVLYPEWIDEEEEGEVPACPLLPEPQIEKGMKFDMVAVKLPCSGLDGWSRDVARLHLQLAAAKLAAKGLSGVQVLFVTECFPIPNLFRCKDLVKREGNLWLYEPELAALKEKLQLPIGSCELAVPFRAEVRPQSGSGAREAYATILHSAEIYVCGAIAAARSIRLSGSTRDLVILVDASISAHHRSGLEAAGWKVRTISRIRNPKAEKNAYNEYNYSKFRLWQLTEYDKVIFIDADLLILRNIDFLFAMPEISATGNNATIFNSGVMVVEPCNCTFQLLMDNIEEITSYNGGDQGYLNEIFTWWHRIPKRMNFLKHFWEGDSDAVKAKKTRLFSTEEPDGLYVLHYLGMKPWLCFRDFDCNWNSILYRSFASDEAHATWWRVHDSMDERLQRFCLLPTVTKAGLEYNRRKAQAAGFPDRHWERNVTDPRRGVCAEKYCDWEDVLRHWGQPAKKLTKSV